MFEPSLKGEVATKIGPEFEETFIREVGTTQSKEIYNEGRKHSKDVQNELKI